MPEYQILHAIEHCHGSACKTFNVFVDGVAVANRLRAEDPEAFRLLTQVRVRFENDGGDGSTTLVSHMPIIQLSEEPSMVKQGGEPRVEAIRFSSKSGGYAPVLPIHTLKHFYQ